MSSPERLSSSISASALKTEEELRDKIKELQEKRATGLMNEISELRKEKGLAVTRIKKMDNIVADIRKENAVMKQKERNMVSKIQSLERQLLEEKLVSESYKKKYQSQENKNRDLAKRLETRECFSYHRGLKASEKCNSLTDLSTMGYRDMEEHSNLSLCVSKQIPSSLSPSCSPVPSPSVIHRRYRLATVRTSENETQTDEFSRINDFNSPEDIPRPVLEILASAREDILRLQQQKKVEKLMTDMQKQLHKLALAKQAFEETQQSYEAQVLVLREETEILHESLSQFSDWVQQKLSVLEEDMDLCRIVYSLHGSLSKEADAYEQMRNKLLASESSNQELTKINEQLIKEINVSEEQLKQLRAENRDLKQQLQTHFFSKINELKLHGRNLSLPSPLTKHRKL